MMLKILTIFAVYCVLGIMVTVLSPNNTVLDGAASQCVRATKIYCDVEALAIHK